MTIVHRRRIRLLALPRLCQRRSRTMRCCKAGHCLQNLQKAATSTSAALLNAKRSGSPPSQNTPKCSTTITRHGAHPAHRWPPRVGRRTASERAWGLNYATLCTGRMEAAWRGWAGRCAEAFSREEKRKGRMSGGAVSSDSHRSTVRWEKVREDGSRAGMRNACIKYSAINGI
ncbi:hypothetical protein FA95DRAFT_1599308 [Auriscalpium vulgare]|uniref:Uncharacterized protein n=1 Tax=Auriscalpium vulgare TaxID=40419 RepID=A0ACB8RA16_9AGAM|nr:hypothetical protein FA95DRAFT_1599308 [Auriscalpium vulgare]